MAAFAYAALCDTILPKATQLCCSREDCFILYNIESLVVKYLLLVVAYLQPKLVKSGSTLITGMHSSDRFKINQRKGWPQRGTIYKYRFRCRQTILPREEKYPRYFSLPSFRVLVVSVPLTTWGLRGCHGSGNPSSESEKMFGVTLSQSALTLCPSCC